MPIDSDGDLVEKQKEEGSAGKQRYNEEAKPACRKGGEAEVESVLFGSEEKGGGEV